MAKLSIKEVRDLACEIIAQHPGGIRFEKLREAIAARSPETPKNTMSGSVWDLEQKCSTKVTKPSRGLYVPFTAVEGVVSGAVEMVFPGAIESAVPGAGKSEEVSSGGVKVKESDFYEPFAEWLRTDVDEVSIAEPLGGGGLKAKWGTPDVVGVYKPRAGDLIKFAIEIVTAEIKIDPLQPVVAFGQAAAYRLFSTKTYIAMPTTLTEQDQDRLESLCLLFGIGLVLFELSASCRTCST